jgi:hypothetical protein
MCLKFTRRTATETVGKNHLMNSYNELLVVNLCDSLENFVDFACKNSYTDEKYSG